MSKTENYLRQLEEFDKRRPFVLSDFDVPKEERKNLSAFLQRQIKAGKVGRFENGMYYKPYPGVINKNLIITPSSLDVADKLLDMDNGYVTNLSVYNQLRLTTQFCVSAFFYAANKPFKKIKFKSDEIVRLKACAPVTKHNHYLLSLLDSIMKVEYIPDQSPYGAMMILMKRHLATLNSQQLEELIYLASYYLRHVQALLGAILMFVNQNAAEKIKERLNPSVKYGYSSFFFDFRNKDFEHYIPDTRFLKYLNHFNIYEDPKIRQGRWF